LRIGKRWEEERRTRKVDERAEYCEDIHDSGSGNVIIVLLSVHKFIA